MSPPVNRAPFGVRTERFPPPRKDVLNLSPGQYNIQKYECNYKKYNIGGSSWTRKKLIEEFSQNLGFRNPHILKERKFYRSQGGPGTYDISENIYRKQTSSICENKGFGNEIRFHSFIKEDNPPPDTYFPNITKKSIISHKQLTNIPIFDWDGFFDRFKDYKPKWSQPPNLYTLKHSGALELLDKVISKRGPYDLFTGPRDESTIKNHFGPPSFKGPVNFFNTWPNELDILLHHPKNKYIGRFLKADRFTKKPTLRMMLNDISLCYRDPNDPSPASYNIQKDPEAAKENTHAFNTSVRYARPKTQWKIYPGPGRYDPKVPKCVKPSGPNFFFKSKVGRELFKPVEYTNL